MKKIILISWLFILPFWVECQDSIAIYKMNRCELENFVLKGNYDCKVLQNTLKEKIKKQSISISLVATEQIVNHCYGGYWKNKRTDIIYPIDSLILVIHSVDSVLYEYLLDFKYRFFMTKYDNKNEYVQKMLDNTLDSLIIIEYNKKLTADLKWIQYLTEAARMTKDKKKSEEYALRVVAYPAHHIRNSDVLTEVINSYDLAAKTLLYCRQGNKKALERTFFHINVSELDDLKKLLIRELDPTYIDPEEKATEERWQKAMKKFQKENKEKSKKEDEKNKEK